MSGPGPMRMSDPGTQEQDHRPANDRIDQHHAAQCHGAPSDRSAQDGDAKPGSPAGLRRIIHIDMDAFYASVEQRDNPDLRGLPVAVGHDGPRGVVAAASYEARAFGVRSAMPSVRARRLCPDLIFVAPRFDAYRAVSQDIRAILVEFTRLIEPLSLDEAYLDVTDHLGGRSATAIAAEIRARIQARTIAKGRGLTASAGVSYNKFLAKLASDQRKPNGIFVITPRAGPDFVEALPVSRFHGIGPATAARMAAMGIHTGADLRAVEQIELIRVFGKAGAHFWRISRGIDPRPVQPDRARKSIGAETTFADDLRDPEEIARRLAPLSAKVWRSVSRAGLHGRCVTIKARYGDFQTVTRSHTLAAPVGTEAELLETAISLSNGTLPDPRGIRLIGVTLSGFTQAVPDDPRQLDLFG